MSRVNWRTWNTFLPQDKRHMCVGPATEGACCSEKNRSLVELESKGTWRRGKGWNERAPRHSKWGDTVRWAVLKHTKLHQKFSLWCGIVCFLLLFSIFHVFYSDSVLHYRGEKKHFKNLRLRLGKPNTGWFLLYEVSITVKFIEARNRMMVARG